MEKEVGNIKFVEIDGGIRIEITGDRFKDFSERGCGCIPVMATSCCQPTKKNEKGEDSSCC
jgi:hypothetical protein